MRIHTKTYGHVIRTVGKYQWDKANGHTVDVDDPQVVADLLSQPAGEFGKEFTIAADEPMRQLGLSTRQLEQLVVDGKIATLSQLAELKVTAAAAETLGHSRDELQALVGRAKAALAPAPDAAPEAPAA